MHPRPMTQFADIEVVVQMHPRRPSDDTVPFRSKKLKQLEKRYIAVWITDEVITSTTIPLTTNMALTIKQLVY